jgi:hypothetical protein
MATDVSFLRITRPCLPAIMELHGEFATGYYDNDLKVNLEQLPFLMMIKLSTIAY